MSFKIYDRVRIIYKKGSCFNIYKGYYGEIKNICGQHYYVMLDVLDKYILIDEDHFIHLETSIT